MIIDCHGHVSAPAELWVYKSMLLSHRGEHGRRFPELTDEEIGRIARTYHAWRGEKDAEKFEDFSGFCKSATLDEIRKHGHVLTPGRYVGARAQEYDREPFEEKLNKLRVQLREQMAEARNLNAAIETTLKGLGYGG